MVLGVPRFWVAFPVGSGGVMPAALAVVAQRDRRTEPEQERPNPVERLQRRYVDGHLTEAEFETRLEALLVVDEHDQGVESATRSAHRPSTTQVK
jgi:hypothetical protein